MKIEQALFLAFIILSAVSGTAAQRPAGDRRAPQPPWFERIDADKDGAISLKEYLEAADSFFKNTDKNSDAVLEETELPRRRGENPPPRPEIPPFLFLERGEANLSRAAFDEKARQKFAATDEDNDGRINAEEARALRPPEPPRPPQPPNPNKVFPPSPPAPPAPPTARFLGAEVRFGDKLVEGAPFSAEIVMENTRRLFDGSVVTKQTKGAVYRDRAGRTRREQTLDAIGAFSIGEPQNLVFINDFPAKTHYFIDLNRKTARRHTLADSSPLSETELKDGKTEALGTKILEGVSVEGTRTTFEIPAAQIGSDKPLQVVVEKWYSPELQVIVMSRHVDPLAGEQIFRLTNIRRDEPAADLFAVPGGFKFEK